ncbi:MAG: O-antigen ligase family protein, partial [Mariprofundales bacterium]
PFIDPDIFANGIARDLLVLATALFAAAWNNDIVAQPIHPSAWIFLALCLSSTAYLLMIQVAGAPWFVWRQSLYLTAAWLVFAMLNHQRHRASWIHPLVLFAHLYVVYALIEAFHLQWFHDSGNFLFWSNKIDHFPGPLRQQNQQALFLIISTVLTWRQTIQSQHSWQWELASILPIAGVFLTSSRSGVIILTLAALLAWAFARLQPRMLWILIRTLALGAMLSMTIMAISPTGETNVIAHIQHTVSDSAPSIRVMVWNICLQLWLQHPWLGVGWGNLGAHLYDAAAPVIIAHPEYRSIASHLAGGVTQAHNVILQFLVEGGIVTASALLLLFTALGKLARQWWRSPPPAISPAVTGWICATVILAHGMVSVTIMEPFFMVLLAMALAACFSNNHDSH